jgi:excisionase family DNA binding protein
MRVEALKTGAMFKPTDTDPDLLKRALGDVSRVLRAFEHEERKAPIKHIGPRTIRLRSDGNELELPIEVFGMIKAILGQMAQGNAVMLVPAEKEISTQEIAHLLNVSRPTVVKLMESGDIPFTSTGTGGHRRAKYRDVMEYKQRLAQRQSEALDKLAEIAQLNNMGYED